MLFIPALLVAMASFPGATEFLNHGQLLNGLENPQWFEKNIPLLDKEHLVYMGAQYSYMSSEFLPPVGYGAPYGGIVAAAGHHIAEGRWLRDTRYGQDVTNYWLSRPRQFPKPMNNGVNKDTSDWAYEYSF
ncbi:hypothetical protein FOYG_14079 [Fusarium oxysporum NRRL 32931]|uniref:Uncharacterized protein n=1 Tax=Fusarium oxysporum NRRL 32931 TaxID=660029 RepID=W9HPU4_FUSOX|nr:hypothetical protein FOYG_14079 [Fusarium oxysporum NRRL 32931]